MIFRDVLNEFVLSDESDREIYSGKIDKMLIWHVKKD